MQSPMHLTIHRKPIRSLRIKVSPDGSVTVSAPKRLSDAYIDSFIASRKEWIEKAIQKMKKGREQLPVAGNELLLHGVAYRFEHDPEMKSKVHIDKEEKIIHSGVDLLSKTKQKIWYKSYAKEYLSSMLEDLAHKHKMHYEKLYIRDQKTKWGTCSSKKNIGLNRKLVKMPDTIIEYVICHELAHLKEMNHSKRFWAVVEELYPDYKEAMARVKKYGMSLQ